MIESISAVTHAPPDMSLLSAPSHPLPLARSGGIGARSRPAVAISRRLSRGSSDQPVSNGLLARELASAADSFRFLSRSLVRGLLIEAPAAHLPEHALALHFSLENAKRLLDVIVSNEYLHACCSQGGRTNHRSVRQGCICIPTTEAHSRHEPGGDHPGGIAELLQDLPFRRGVSATSGARHQVRSFDPVALASSRMWCSAAAICRFTSSD